MTEIDNLADLVAFLRARLAEEDRDVQLISSGGYEPDIWRVEPPSLDGRWAAEVLAYSRCLGEPVADAIRDDDAPVALVQQGRNEHLHVERYDPHRMAIEIDAKRRILEACEPKLIDVSQPGELPYTQTIPGARAPWGLPVLRLLALPHAAHPDYRPEWRPQP